MSELDGAIHRAVQQFWRTRARQAARQRGSSIQDRGSRSAVTGGKQMDGFIKLIASLLIDAGVPRSSIATHSRIELPGWFRAEKKWDLVVVHNGELQIALECKSQVGPSFGNNFNNRTEEAIGSAIDIWAAYREGAFKPASRPLLGYFVLVEDCARSRTPVEVVEPHFPVFPEFRGASYSQRYALLVEKLLRDRIYDAGCLILADRAEARRGGYSEPHAELTFARFVTQIRGQAAKFIR